MNEGGRNGGGGGLEGRERLLCTYIFICVSPPLLRDVTSVVSRERQWGAVAVTVQPTTTSSVLAILAVSSSAIRRSTANSTAPWHQLRCTSLHLHYHSLCLIWYFLSWLGLPFFLHTLLATHFIPCMKPLLWGVAY